MKVGIFQSAGGGCSPQERADRLSAAIKGKGIDLVVCPELFISGYNVGIELTEQSDSSQGWHYQLMSEIACQNETGIIYGYPEREGNILYNSAACISPVGKLIANHRKRANSPGSFEEDYFTPADGMTIFTYEGMKVAVVICYEVEFPESIRQAACNGAQLVAVPTALVDKWRVVAERVVPTRAFENGVWVAYANHAGEENGFTYLGGSRIVDPDGVEAAKAGSSEELIVADISKDAVAAAQARLPYLRDFGRFSKTHN
ncbi:MAG: carbon-nitrogen hydrolase family protein [Pseudomonadota bacterium]